MQVRKALAEICNLIRSSEDCQGQTLEDMVIALRASPVMSTSDEITLVVAVAAPQPAHAWFAVDQAVQLINSLRF